MHLETSPGNLRLGSKILCGIAGIFGGASPSQCTVERTLTKMGPRGPNAQGVLATFLNGIPITILHSRLSIIDLDNRSNQPFEIEGVSLTFNGEIYNYKAIRALLKTKGANFVTDGDTEVVAKAYLYFGLDCFDMFEGMWALALIDHRNGCLVLSRDRFGEKPLYFMQSGDRFVFASETSILESLLDKSLTVNTDQINRFLVNGYKSLNKTSDTFFKEVRQIEPSSYIVLTEPKNLGFPKKYWSLKQTQNSMTKDVAQEQANELLENAVKLRLRSDVPIAFCLSGGVDSTTLVSMANSFTECQLSTFSIYDSDKRYDEAANIEAIVKKVGSKHTAIHLKNDGFLDRLKKLVGYFNAPVATVSFYIQSYLAEAIGDAGFRVAITGNGADELYSGYYDHYNFWLAELSESTNLEGLISDWRSGYGAFVRNPILKDPECFIKNPLRRDHIYLKRNEFSTLLLTPFSENFAEKAFPAGLLRSRLLNEIFHETLPVLLNDSDLIFMRSSIENRNPYLDRNLAEFLFSLPTEFLIQKGMPKAILRRSAEGFVPDKVRLDKMKKGFNASIRSIVDLKSEEMQDWLHSSSAVYDLVDRDKLLELVAEADGSNSVSKFLFSFFGVKAFFDNRHLAA